MSIFISPLIPDFMIIRILANHVVIFLILILKFLITITLILILIKKFLIHFSMIPRTRNAGVLNGAIHF